MRSLQSQEAAKEHCDCRAQDLRGAVVNQRIDLELVRRGLARSRAEANSLIKAGQILVDGKTAEKPSQLVSGDVELQVNDGGQLASRAGGKLALAVAELRREGFNVAIAGQNCLDIGASTGGFTQVLLENGAASVVALDVGHGQLRPEIRENSHVIVMERVNARYLTADQLPFQPQFIAADVSFISLKMLFPAIGAVAAPGAQVLLLIKPQFEVGKGKLGKGGVVRDQQLISHVLDDVAASAHQNGIQVTKVMHSQVVGTNGNQEYFLFGHL